MIGVRTDMSRNQNIDQSYSCVICKMCERILEKEKLFEHLEIVKIIN